MPLKLKIRNNKRLMCKITDDATNGQKFKCDAQGLNKEMN
jgi:hypothetical protein